MDYKELYEKLKEQQYRCQKKYYAKNKDTINEKLICVTCGGRFTRTHIKQHISTKKHQLALENNKMLNFSSEEEF
jgi:hypothetical protein